MSPALAKRLRLLASALSVLALLAVIAAGWFYWKLRASRPQLEGTVATPGLSAPVSIARDGLGVPTLRGENRLDLARATGYLHAHDRFFQMDTLRRRAAGELSEIAGPVALGSDRSTRIHGFRRLAQAVLARVSSADRAVLEAYAQGVNLGLSSLGAKPFEYTVLRVDPQPWRPEDSLLVSYAMCLELEDSKGNYERSLMTMRDKLGSAATAFFAPLVTPDDAAIDGSSAPAAPTPTAQQLNLRNKTGSAAIRARPASRPSAAGESPGFFASLPGRDRSSPDTLPGSNNFALGGSRTANGGALLANDMHLELRVPNTWYRASLEWPGHAVTGITLPGTPWIVVGSNRHIAWGFTASQVDRTDLVVVQVSADRLFYLHGRELVPFETRRETILVKGAEPEVLETQWTQWGPIVGQDERTRPLALHWAAHDPEAANVELSALETTGTVDDAINVAHRAGITALNFLVADEAGHIAWTIAGRLPRRFGSDGRFPVSWYYGDRGWNGLLPPGETPTVRGGADGQLWTANNRVIGGAGLALLGDGDYTPPPRAAQIRDRLTSLTKAVPRDLLGVQLDDRALFLSRWQQALLTTLTPEVVAKDRSRGEFRDLVAHWDARATDSSVGYRLVRAWRATVTDFALEPVFASCVEHDPAFHWQTFNYEPALWRMLQEQPPHLLDPRFASWDALRIAAVDDVIEKLAAQGLPLAGATWGQRNTARIRHPLAAAFPAWMTGWLSMPSDPLPGDASMPRVQTPTFGASERMVVSPGHEAEGIFHMPGGQSAHPLSPYYRAGHKAWVRGEPTPFLPGPAEHTLVLQPAGTSHR